MKRFIFAAVAAMVLVSGAQAQNSVWNGTADKSWYDETKSEFTISTAEQLAGLAELVNDRHGMSGKTITLGADIWLNDTTDWQKWNEYPPKNEWKPIGQLRSFLPAAKFFAGTFDAKGYAVYGMYIKFNAGSGFTWQSQGLFGMIYEAKITNLMLSNFYIFSRNVYTGSIAGFGGASVIEKCSIKGKIDGKLFVGGVCGGSKFKGAFAFQFYCGNLSIIDNLVLVNVSLKKIGGGISGFISDSKITGNNFDGNVYGKSKTGILVGEAKGESIVSDNKYSNKNNLKIVSKPNKQLIVKNNTEN